MRFALVALAACGITVWAADASAQRRVAVFSFDNPPTALVPVMVRTPGSVSAVPANVGKTAADLLIDKLVRSGSCRVIERQALDKLLAEQNLSNSDRVDTATAARLGRILGVDAIVLGSVTRYDQQDRTTGHSHNYGGFRVGSPTKSTHEISAHVQISTRLVSPETAEILAVDQGNGASIRKGVKEDIMDQYYGRDNVSAPILAEATDQAITELASHLQQSIAKVPLQSANISALVAGVNSAGLVIINAGARRGVKVGDRFEVFRSGTPIRDPETGNILRSDDKHLGEAVVKDVDDLSAAAAYTGEPVKEGDRVRKEHAQDAVAAHP